MLRTRVEIRAARDEYRDRIWRWRTLAPPSRTAGELAATEGGWFDHAAYPEAITDDAFTIGEFEGRLSALCWVLGGDWSADT